MVIFYCPNCWREITQEQRVCVHCGQQISLWDEKTFTEKLISALSHPEPTTQDRAIYLLGERKATEAVSALTALYRRSGSPFLQAEIIEAIGKIGGESGYALLTEALRHPSFIVRVEAVKALACFRTYEDVRPALERALNDPSSCVRERCRKTLERLEEAGWRGSDRRMPVTAGNQR